MLGAISSRDEDDFHVVEVAFHNSRDRNRVPHLQDFFGITLAALCDKVWFIGALRDKVLRGVTRCDSLLRCVTRCDSLLRCATRCNALSTKGPQDHGAPGSRALRPLAHCAV